MNTTYDDHSGPGGPESTDAVGRFGKRLAIVLFLSFAVAAVIHLYRNNQLPLVQQPLPGFDHALLDSPGSKEGEGARDNPSSGPSQAIDDRGRQITVGAWARQNFAALSVDAPVPMTSQPPDDHGLTPFQISQLVDRHEWAGRTADGFQVEAVSFQIDGRHTLSLEDGARGPVLHFAKKCGDPNPAYGKVDGFVNGMAARHLSYRYGVGGSTRHLEELIVQNTRSMMGIVVTFTGDAHVGDAQRVLASLQVRAGN
jgi:hypothetical protein